MIVSAILIFLGKVILIDIAIELLRQITYTIYHNKWAKEIVGKSKNPYFNWFLNVFELLSTMILLYFQCNMFLIIGMLFVATMGIKSLEPKILHNNL